MSSVESLRSAKSTVTCLRSPSSAGREVRIFSARKGLGCRRGGRGRVSLLVRPAASASRLRLTGPDEDLPPPHPTARRWPTISSSSQVLQGLIVELKLPLERAIGQAAPLAQQRDHLIQDRDKAHPHPLLAWYLASVLMGEFIIA